MSEREQLIKGLYGNLATMRRLMADTMQGEYGLPASQCELLFIVNHEGSLPLKKLAEAMQLTPGAISQLVESLENAGLVERVPSPTDRRVTLISLTEAGLLKLAKGHVGKKGSLMHEMIQILSEDELRTMHTIHTKMIALLKARKPEESKD